MRDEAKTYWRAAFVDVGFTRYNLYAFLLAACVPSDDLYAVTTCTSWGIFVSFHAALLFDPTCFRRIADSMDMSVRAFHFANLAMHALPCLITLLFPARRVAWWHGGIAMGVHWAWGAVRSGGTMRLDVIYVPMPVTAWRAMWTVATCTELAAPLIHSINLLDFF